MAIRTGSGWFPGVRHLDDLIDRLPADLRTEPYPPAKLAPGAPATIVYTSGSTGFPKGVLLHHRGLTNNSRHYTRFQGMPETPTSLLIAPLFHTAGCAMMVLGQGQAGGTIIAPPLFDPALANLLIELGVEPVMTTATVESLRRATDQGVPDVPGGLGR